MIQKYKKEINELKIKLQVATDMSNISTIASLEDGKKDKELMLLQQERIKVRLIKKYILLLIC